MQPLICPVNHSITTQCLVGTARPHIHSSTCSHMHTHVHTHSTDSCSNTPAHPQPITPLSRSSKHAGPARWMQFA